MAAITKANDTADLRVNGLGGTLHILTITDTSTTGPDDIRLEAETEGFTVVGIEGSGTNGVTQDGDVMILQGTGTPTATGCTVLGTIGDNNS